MEGSDWLAYIGIVVPIQPSVKSAKMTRKLQRASYDWKIFCTSMDKARIIETKALHCVKQVYYAMLIELKLLRHKMRN